MKDEAYAINLDEYKSIRTHWIAFMEMLIIRHISVILELNIQLKKEIKRLIGNKNIIKNIYRMQDYETKMCGFFCTGFIHFMLNNQWILLICFSQTT